jgi:hypothetical protein
VIGPECATIDVTQNAMSITRLLSAACLTATVMYVSTATFSRSPLRISKELPSDRTESIPSPDGLKVLIASPLPERTLVLEDKATQKQTLIKKYDRTIQVGWSPNSLAFFFMMNLPATAKMHTCTTCPS